MTVTLSDIAREANVSKSTVCRVLANSKIPIAVKTRKRVLEIDKRMEYRPNLYAKSLVKKRPFALQLFIDLSYDAAGENGASNFIRQNLLGFATVAKEKGYHVNLDFTLDSGDGDFFQGNIPFAGSMVLSPRRGNQKIPFLIKAKIPFIVVDSSEYRQCNYIGLDHVLGSSMATEHLIKLGHKDIACLGGPTNYQPSLDRMAGFRRTMRSYGLPCREEWIMMGEWIGDVGYRRTLDILQGDSKKPTAIFACNDMLAMGVIMAVKSLGLKVPDDIAVVSMDDLPISSLIDPPLTTVTNPIYEMAQLATRKLIEFIETKQDSDVLYQDLFVPQLVVRASCGARKNQTMPVNPNKIY